MRAGNKRKAGVSGEVCMVLAVVLLSACVQVALPSSVAGSSSSSSNGTGETPHHHPKPLLVQHHGTGRSYSSGSEGRIRNPWARDSYTDAAAVVGAAQAIQQGGGMSGGGGGETSFSQGDSSGGYAAAASTMQQAYGPPQSSYGAPGGQAEPYRFMYQITPSQQQDLMMSGSGWGGMDDDEDSSDIASLIGLIGLKGVKGIKALKKAKLFKLLALLPLLPILLPILLPLLLLLLAPLLLLALLPLALLLFIPVPVVIMPGGGGRSTKIVSSSVNGTVTESRMMTTTSTNPEIAKILSEEYSRIFSSFLSSSECIERISCELGRVSRNYKASGFTKMVTNKLSRLDANLPSRIEQASQNGVKCRRYQCGPF